MTPVPEPAGDIRAQLTAVFDPGHPKKACFLVPEDAERLDIEVLPEGVYPVVRFEGTLVTIDFGLALEFEDAPSETAAFDTAMAGILGLGEAKPLMVERCHGGSVLGVNVVQARDVDEHVVIETFTSPEGFLKTCDLMQQHVPPGGRLVVIGAVLAISRRVALRWVEG